MPQLFLKLTNSKIKIKFEPITILNQNYNSIESRSERGAYIRPMPAFNTNRLIPARAYYYFQNKIDILSQSNTFKCLVHTFAFVEWFISYLQVLSSYKNAARKSGRTNANHYHVFSFYLYIVFVTQLALWNGL